MRRLGSKSDYYHRHRSHRLIRDKLSSEDFPIDTESDVSITKTILAKAAATRHKSPHVGYEPLTHHQKSLTLDLELPKK